MKYCQVIALNESVAEDLPVDFLISGYLFGKTISSTAREHCANDFRKECLDGKPTDGFSGDVNVSKPSHHMYSLVCQYKSSFTRVLDCELCLAWNPSISKSSRLHSCREFVPSFPAIRPIARFLCSPFSVFTSLISKLSIN